MTDQRNLGWECPKCGSVYAPWMTRCTVCGPKPKAESTSEMNEIRQPGGPKVETQR